LKKWDIIIITFKKVLHLHSNNPTKSYYMISSPHLKLIYLVREQIFQHN